MHRSAILALTSPAPVDDLEMTDKKLLTKFLTQHCGLCFHSCPQYLSTLRLMGKFFEM